MRTRRWVGALALLAISTPAAQAGNCYVDAVNGSNANSGTSWAQAWQTITHAAASTAGPDVIHIAPGFYDSALGEVFPIQLGKQSLIGAAGPETTILDGGGASTILYYQPTFSPTHITIEGLRLQNAGQGLFDHNMCYMDWCQDTFTLRRVVISGMTGCGALIHAWNDWWDADFTVRMEQVVIEQCGTAFQLRADGNAQNPMYPPTLYTYLDCLDSKIQDNGNGLEKWTVGEPWANETEFNVDRSTLVGNSGHAINNWGNWDSSTIKSSILFHNGSDINGACSVSYSDTEHSLHPGVGNISTDPLFSDPAAGDYRLRFGSPCADAGEPQAPPGGWPPDLLGTPRPVDGDLDTLTRIDMGAFELAPLYVPGKPQPGGTLAVELWGSVGALSQVWIARQPAGPGQGTPFGSYHLLPPLLPLGLHCAQPGPPGGFQRAIPNDPQLYGRTFCLQALTRSPSAPAGGAWTNPVEVTFLP